MTIQRWNPFLRDFVSLRDAVDRLFEESFVSPERLFTAGTGTRPMGLEVYETPDEVVVRALTPGVSSDALDIQYHEGVLTLRARSQAPESHDDWTWHLREIPYGEMVRSITLPRQIDAEHAQASFQDGVLTLRMPKTEQAKPRTIPIQQTARIGSGGQGGSDGQTGSSGQTVGSPTSSGTGMSSGAGSSG
jgi:HSP20 family protein